MEKGGKGKNLYSIESLRDIDRSSCFNFFKQSYHISGMKIDASKRCPCFSLFKSPMIPYPMNINTSFTRCLISSFESNQSKDPRSNARYDFWGKCWSDNLPWLSMNKELIFITSFSNFFRYNMESSGRSLRSFLFWKSSFSCSTRHMYLRISIFVVECETSSLPIYYNKRGNLLFDFS